MYDLEKGAVSGVGPRLAKEVLNVREHISDITFHIPWKQKFIFSTPNLYLTVSGTGQIYDLDLGEEA